MCAPRPALITAPLLQISLYGALIWIVLLISHIRFRSAMKYQNYETSTLAYQAYVTVNRRGGISKADPDRIKQSVWQAWIDYCTRVYNHHCYLQRVCTTLCR